MTSRPWYRRFPDNFIAGTVGLTLEEKGAYSLVLDLMYVRGGPVPDEPRYIAGVCNCSVRKWNAIRQKLIESGKLRVVDECLTNERAENEIEKSAKEAREFAENGAKGGNKAAENRAGSSKNNGLGAARLKHTRVSPLQDSIYKKGDMSFDPTATITVDRWSEEKLFKACEKLRGKPTPASVQKWSFPASVVEAARRELAH